MKEEKIKCPLCKGTGIFEKKLCKGCHGKKLVHWKMAPQIEIEYLSTYVDTVMDAIETVTGISGALITDRSSVWDFADKGEEAMVAKKLAIELGIPVDSGDTIVTLAKRVKNL